MDDFSNMDEDEQRDLLDEAYLYITEGCYPDGCGADQKRTIRRKAKEFTVNTNGELFYRKKGKKIGSDSFKLKLSPLTTGCKTKNFLSASPK